MGYKSFKLYNPKGDWKFFVPAFLFLAAIGVGFFASNNGTNMQTFRISLGVALMLGGLWGIIVRKFFFGRIFPTRLSGKWAMLVGILLFIMGLQLII